MSTDQTKTGLIAQMREYCFSVPTIAEALGVSQAAVRSVKCENVPAGQMTTEERKAGQRRASQKYAELAGQKDDRLMAEERSLRDALYACLGLHRIRLQYDAAVRLAECLVALPVRRFYALLLNRLAGVYGEFYPHGCWTEFFRKIADGTIPPLDPEQIFPTLVSMLTSHTRPFIPLPLSASDERDIDRELELRLEERELQVLRLRWGYDQEPLGCDEIAKRLDISSVEGIAEQAINKLLRNPGKEWFRKYLLSPSDLWEKGGRELLFGQAGHIIECAAIEQARSRFLHVEKGEQVSLPLTERLNIPLTSLPFLLRTHHILEAAGLERVRDLLGKIDQDLLRYRNCGRKTIWDINDTLATLGIFRSNGYVEVLQGDRLVPVTVRS